jgi:hypothetical protein
MHVREAALLGAQVATCPLSPPGFERGACAWLSFRPAPSKVIAVDHEAIPALEAASLNRRYTFRWTHAAIRRERHETSSTSRRRSETMAAGGLRHC